MVQAWVALVSDTTAELTASVFPNSLPTTAWFEWGTNASYGQRSASQDLGSENSGNPTLNLSLDRLAPGAFYHFRAVAQNSAGTTFGPNQAFATMSVAPPVRSPGDANGDGVVDQAELNAVLVNYWPNLPGLAMTNMATWGAGDFQFSLPSADDWRFGVLASTNLVDWESLPANASPVWKFVDPEATNHPVRFYRLHWP